MSALTAGRAMDKALGWLGGALGALSLIIAAHVPVAVAQDASVAVATRVAVGSDRNTTTFRLGLSRGVTVEVFTLPNPYRVIIDLPNVSFQLPKGAGRKGSGLVTAFRYGLFAAGKARVVIDTRQPVLISKAEMINSPSGGGVELLLSLVGTDAASFGSGTGSSRAQAKSQPASVKRERAPKPRENGRSRPLIVLDPGHGGIDPGAVGTGNVYEKNLVLSVSRRLARVLRSRGRFEVLMTRTKDVFVSLDDRLAFSARHQPDLFISLHADAIANEGLAQHIRGATVYTLSEKASDEQARLMAEKENSADLVAGIGSRKIEAEQGVTDILIDLMRRETANFSTDFSNALVSRLRKSVKLSRKPKRSAAFKVLKQTKTPSVLVELGYLSNAKEEKVMQTAEWQNRVAKSIADAVDAYFSRRSARAR